MAMVTIPAPSGGTPVLPQPLDTTDSPTFAGLVLTGFDGLVRATAGTLSAGALVAADIPNLDAAKITTGVLPIARGGTANGTALTNGQLFVGKTGFAPVLATLTGTANQVIVTNGAGTITLSLPQNIGSSSHPTFDSLDVTTLFSTFNATITGQLRAEAGVALAGLATDVGTTLVLTMGGDVALLTSTREHKMNIQSINGSIDSKVILKTDPRMFEYKANPGKKIFGFIAEEVADIEPKLVLYKDDKPFSIQYMNFVPLIVDILKQHEDRLNILSFKEPQRKDEEVIAVSSRELAVDMSGIKKRGRARLVTAIVTAIIGLGATIAYIPKAIAILLK